MGQPWNLPDETGVSDLDRLRSLVDAHPTIDTKTAQAHFPDRTFRGIQKQLTLLRNPDHQDRTLIGQFAQPRRPPQSTKPILNEQVRLPGPSALVLSDLHIPYHHADFIEQCVSLAVAWGVPDLVINGDLLDVENFSKWEAEPSATFEEELAGAEEMLAYMAASFKRVVITIGNHEARILGNAMKRQVRVTRFLRMFTTAPNVEISSYEFSEMDSPTGLWRFIHPASASVIAGRVPTIIASRRFTDSHCVGAHGHLRSIGRTEDGKRWAVDSGCCLDTTRVAYSVMRVSNRPVMVNGALVIFNGYPYALEPQLDWTAMMGLYGKPA